MAMYFKVIKNDACNINIYAYEIPGKKYEHLHTEKYMQLLHQFV
jgi:hypothetical protein